MSDLDFRVRLRNELSGAAEAAASDLRELQVEAKGAATAIDALERKQKTVARTLSKTSASSALGGTGRQRGMSVYSGPGYARRTGPTARKYGPTGSAFAATQRSREALMRGPSGANLGAVNSAASGASSGIASSFSGAAAIAGITAVAAAVGMLIVKFGQLAASAGTWLLQMKLQRDASLLSFKLMFGGVEQASAVYKQAIGLSMKLGQTAEETVSVFQSLGAQGMKAPEIETMVKSLADLKLVAPSMDPKRAISAIGQIMSKGKLGLEELQGQLGDSANLNVGYVKDALGQILKVRGKTEAEIRGGVDKMISAGEIDSLTGIKAVQMAISRMAGGGKPGVAAEAASKSLGGVLMQLSALPKNLALSMDMPGTGPILAFGQAILKVLDVTKAPAKALQDSIGGLFATVTSVLFGDLPGEAGIEKVVYGVADALDTIDTIINNVAPITKAFLGGLSEGFGEAWDAVSPVAAELADVFGAQFSSRGEMLATVARAVGKGFAYMAIAVGAVVAVVAALGAVIPGIVTGLAYVATAIVATVTGGIGSAIASIAGFATAAFEAGTSIVDGVANGILAGLTRVADAATSIGSTAVSAVTSTLDIHSPSRVMAALGAHTSAGFAVGVNDNAGPVDGAMTSLVSPPSAPSAGGGGRGGGGIVINLTINASGGDSDHEGLARVVTLAIRDAFDQMGAEMAFGT